MLVIGAESRAVEVEKDNATVPETNTRASTNHDTLQGSMKIALGN